MVNFMNSMNDLNSAISSIEYHLQRCSNNANYNNNSSYASNSNSISNSSNHSHPIWNVYQNFVDGVCLPQANQSTYGAASEGGNNFNSSVNNDKLVVSVIVPQGVSAGQIMYVTATDGSGRVTAATVPEGLQPGSTFLVEFPSSIPPSTSVPAAVTSNQQDNREDNSAEQSNNEEGTTSRPVSCNQSYIQVQVPPGAAPGSTIHVQVPGEDRTVSAIVPPGEVTQFHVAYQPALNERDVPQVVTPTHHQGIMTVQVPPGASPGTTLHVQVPGEDRLIAAVVPDGVSEFQISYDFS